MAVAAYDLNPQSASVCNALIESQGWSDLLAVVNSQRLTGLLARMVADGVLEVDERQSADALSANESAMTLAVLLEQRLLQVVRLFDERCIDYRVLKGSASARLHYGDPSLRPFGDLDIMVRAADIDRVIALLEAMGGQRRYREPRPGYLRRFGKGAAVVLDEYTEMDIHRTISPGPFGMRLDPDLFFDGESRFAVGGRLISAPRLEERLLHACHHAVLGDAVPRLLALRDVAQILTAMPVDHGRLMYLAEKSGGGAVVARAVTMTQRIFGLDDASVTTRWASRFVPTGRDQMLLNFYAGSHRSSARLTVESVREIDLCGDRAAFLFASVFPSDRIGVEGVNRWRSGFRSILRSRSTQSESI